MSTDLPSELQPDRTDRLAAALRSAAGAVPLAGGLLTEIVGTIIRNQRLERLTRFVAILSDRLGELEARQVEERGRTEEFADLLEDGLHQAARALSDGRLSYIASALKNGLNDEQLRHLEKKRLLGLLGEINDLEVIILHSKWHHYVAVSPFWEIHHDALIGWSHLAQTGTEYSERKALFESHAANLRRLGLLEQEFRVPSDRDIKQKGVRAILERRASGDRVTQLGRILLRFIESEANVPGAAESRDTRSAEPGKAPHEHS